MTMNAIASSLDLWEGLKNCSFWALFEKTSVFNENVPPEDGVIDEIWQQIFLMLSTQDSVNSVGFLKIFWEHWEPELNFQVAKIAIFEIFSSFIDIQGYPAVMNFICKIINFVKMQYLKNGTWRCHEIKKIVNCTSKGCIFKSYHFLEEVAFKMNKNDRRTMFEVSLITSFSILKRLWLIEKEAHNKLDLSQFTLKFSSIHIPTKSLNY